MRKKSEQEAAFRQRLQLLNRLQGEKNSLRTLEVDQKARPTGQRAEEIRTRQERVFSLKKLLG